MAANTFVELNDTPSSYTSHGNKFLVVRGDESSLNFTNISMEKISDVNVTGAYVPVGGQVLQYSSGAGEWRAMDNDPYSFGAGLNKSAGTIDVIASGGLVANASGIYIQDIANVAGVYGNATHVPQFTVNNKGQVVDVEHVEISVPSADALTADYVGNVTGTAGQITVTGGTGNNSNAALNLVATGVTAGVYGNATHAPQITVDTYGRLQNVELIQLSAGDGAANSSLGFRSIAINGQTTISADQVEDALTFVAGAGVTLTTDASNDSITFGIAGSALVSDADLGDLQNVDVSGIADGQAIRWVAANSQFEPYTITDQGILYTDLSGANGISYDNTSGEISLPVSGATAGTYGNADTVAQVTINDRGIVTNVTNVSIRPDTGVTAGTYGNATTVPRITVGADGRVTSIVEESSAQYVQSVSWNSATSELSLSGGGNTISLDSLNQNGFRTFVVSGQDNIVADKPEDAINLVAGAGISITTDATTDTITISNTGGSGGGGNSNVQLSSFSVATAAASGGGALSYNSTNGQFTFTPADLSSIVGSQNLSWDSGTSTLSISSGNSVDLSSLLDNVDSQAISLSGNVISISGDASTVDLGPLLGSVDSNYGDANVASYLSAQGYATQSAIVAAITDSAPATLDTLNELAAALGDDPNFATTTTNNLALKANSADLHAVATSGDYTDLTNRPTIALSGSDLSYDGTTLDLSGVGAVGPQGNVGPTGATGNGITNATVSSGELILTYSNTSVQNLGDITGPQGPQGNVGSQGPQGIQGATGPQGATGDAGADGADGSDGVGVTSVSLVGGNLVFAYSNTSTQDVGNIQGPTGSQGPAGNDGADGTSISSGSVTNGVITLTMSDSSTITVSGNVEGSEGATGATGPQGPQGNVGATGPQGAGLNDVSVTTASASGSGSLAYNSGSGVFTFTPPDLSSYLTSETDNQTLSLAGNVITISGSSSSVDLTSILGTGGGGTPGGSDGQLQYNNGGSFGGIADLHWDDSNDRLGIGTSSPAVKLHISGDAAQESQLRMSQYNNDADAPDIRFFKARGTEATPTNISAGDKLAAFNVEARTGGAFKEMGTISFVSSSTNTGASVLKFGTKSNSEASNLYPSTKFEITEEGNIKFNNTYTFPSSDGSAGQVLQTDGSGTLSFATVSGGGGIALTDLSGTDGVEYSNTTGVINLTDTGVSAGTYGSSTLVPRITVDAKGRVTSVSTQAVSGGGGGGGSGATVERFKLNYTSAGALDSITDTTGGISGVSIDSASGGDVTVTFTGYNFPPASIMIYGYVYASNKYQITPLESSMGLREVPGGGSAGAPSLFGGSGTPTTKLRLREAETGASRSFGTVTHAWVQFVMYD